MSKKQNQINISTSGGDFAGRDIIKTTVVQTAVGNNISQGAGASVVINNRTPNRGRQGVFNQDNQIVQGQVNISGNGYVAQAVGVNVEAIHTTYDEDERAARGPLSANAQTVLDLVQAFVEAEYEGEWPLSLKKFARYIEHTLG